MKAIIKETGDPIEDLIIYDSTGNQWPLDDVELIPDTHSLKEIDWEERRFELVKAAMPALNGMEDFEINAKNIVEYADAVLAEYRKGGEE